MIIRTLKIEPTPAEMALSFANMDSEKQAAFFSALGELVRSWPGTGWCAQACNIIADVDLTENGRNVIRRLGEHQAARDEA